jgi:hypothetical protein
MIAFLSQGMPCEQVIEAVETERVILHDDNSARFLAARS